MGQKPQMIKLVHVTTVPQSLFFLTGQANYMRSRNFDISALSSSSELLSIFAEQEQMSVHSVDMPRRITPLQDVRAIYQISRWLWKIHPHIVHTHTPKGGLLGMISAWLMGVPVRIYHIHGLPLMTATGFKQQLLWWSEKFTCLLAHQVLCVSPSICEIVIQENLCKANKCKVLLNGSINGVDAEHKFNPANFQADIRKVVRSRYNIAEDALVIGFVGRIVRDKGIVELTQAWEALQELYPDLHLLIVGPYESQDPVPSDIVKKLQNNPQVHIVGFTHTDVPQLYTAMDVLVLPTYREGFPVVPLEAAAMALPVIATYVPGCVDAIVDGETGTLVPPRNVEALVKAIRTYIEQPEIRSNQGKRGRARVLQDFRPEDIWTALHQEYMRVFNKNCQNQEQSSLQLTQRDYNNP